MWTARSFDTVCGVGAVAKKKMMFMVVTRYNSHIMHACAGASKSYGMLHFLLKFKVLSTLLKCLGNNI